MKIIVCFALIIAPLASVTANVTVGGIFGDNMVLQRGVDIPVWGTADQGEKVTVEINGIVRDALPDKDGKWTLGIGTFQAGGPYVLKISGNNVIEIKNVMIGDVWLCSGQSNMQYYLKDEAEGEQALSGTMPQGIRFIRIGGTSVESLENPPNVFPHLSNNWMECRPEYLKWFSSIAYYFGSDLSEQIGVPIGLIETSQGSTPIRSWISPDIQKSSASFKDELNGYDAYQKKKQEYDSRMAEYQMASEKSKRDGSSPPAHPGYMEAYANAPGVLYNARIHPLTPFAIKGIIWYQGENEAIYKYTSTYDDHFSVLIDSWRKLWKQDLPFIFVQLAPIGKLQENPGESYWAEIRNAQRKALRLPNTAMVVTTDICEANLHPRNKKKAAQRLAKATQAIAYGKSIEYSGPLLEKAEFNDDSVKIYFTHTGEGLVAMGGALKGFSIAGKNGPSVWADAKIEGNAVTVSSKIIKHPRLVRYAWSDNPIGNLFNTDGLPASCFEIENP